MGIIAYLKQGAQTLNLNGDAIRIEEGWQPPAVNNTASFARGTSANLYDGSTKVSERGEDRFMELPILLKASNSTASIAASQHRLENFLLGAGRETPVQFVYRPDDSIESEPLWGTYGSNLVYEIIHAVPSLVGNYGVGTSRARYVRTVWTCRLKPYYTTTRLKLATATGFVHEDKYGFSGIGSRGLIVAKAGTNLFTNPVFGHATFTNGWTVGSDLSVSLVNDPLLFGDIPQCVEVLYDTGAGTTVLTQQVTCANTNLHALTCYAKRRDNGPIVGATMTYGGLQAPTTWDLIGNGVYRGTAWPTGIASAQPAGIDFTDKGTLLYLTGFQIEDTGSAVTDYSASPFFYGDMLGCAWSGTAHASTSTRTAGSVKIDCPTAVNPQMGTFRVVWKSDVLSSNFTGDITLFDTGELRLDYLTASNIFRFYVNYSANFVSTAVVNFAVGDTLTIHCAYSSGTYRAISINGVTVSSATSYTVPDRTANLFIGSTTSSTQQCAGVIREFSTYNVAITSTEALADYTNLAGVISEDVGIASIPRIWSKDGDNITDNGLDIAGSTGFPHTNWVLMSGVPGTLPAITDLYGVNSSAYSVIKATWINCFSIRKFYNPLGDVDQVTGFTFCKGTTTTNDTTATRGRSTVQSVNTAAVEFGSTLIGNVQGLRELLGKPFVVLARVKDAGANLTANVTFIFGSTSYASEYLPVTSNASNYVLINPPFKQIFPSLKAMFQGKNATLPAMQIKMNFKRSTAGAANVTFDYFQILPADTVKISGATSTETIFVLSSGRGGAGGTPTVLGDILALASGGLEVRGNPIELEPNTLNLYTVWSGDETINPLLSYTVTNSAFVTPRWGLL